MYKFLFLCVFAFFPSTSHADVYKWVDSEGNTHFGDRPIPSSHVQTVSIQERKILELDLDITAINHKLSYFTEEKTKRAIRTMRSIFLDQIGMELNKLDRFTIKIFGQLNDFQAYQLANYQGVMENANGLYSSDKKEAIVWKNQDLKTMLKVLTHEISHALFDIEFPYRPLWLNEGLAEYMENLDVFGQTVYIRPNGFWKQALRKHQKDRTLPPLKEFLSWDWRQWRHYDQSSQGMGYAISWSLCFMLMDKRQGTPYMASLIKDLIEQKSNFNAVASVNRFYPNGIKGLQTDWERWLSRAYVPGHSY